MEKGLAFFVVTVLILGTIFTLGNVSLKSKKSEGTNETTVIPAEVPTVIDPTLTPTITLPPKPNIIRRDDDDDDD